jgi:hypothetical protein
MAESKLSPFIIRFGKRFSVELIGWVLAQEIQNTRRDIGMPK